MTIQGDSNSQEDFKTVEVPNRKLSRMNLSEKSKSAMGVLNNRIRKIPFKWKERKEISSTEKTKRNNYHNKFTNSMITNMKNQNDIIINRLVPKFEDITKKKRRSLILKWIVKTNIKHNNNAWTNNRQIQRIQIRTINHIKMKNHRKSWISKCYGRMIRMLNPITSWMSMHQNLFLARKKESNTKTIIIINMHK